MGGINSGRPAVIWGREKPIVEDCAALSIFALQKAGVLINGASGVFRWDGNTLSYQTYGDVLTIEYRTRGHEVIEQITVAAIPLYWRNGTSRACFICPGCERRSYKLYLSNRRLDMVCRLCGRLVYEQQTYHYGSLMYRYWQSIKADRKDEARCLAAIRKEAEQARAQLQRYRVRKARRKKSH